MIDDTLDSLKSQMGHLFVSEEDYDIGNENEADASEKRKRVKAGGALFGCVGMDYARRMVLGIGFLVAGLLLLGVSPLFIDVPTDFVWVHAFANVFVLCSCVFVLGPVRQLRVLVHNKTKVLAVVMYLGAMAGALVAALNAKMAGATVLCVVTQICSAVWYLGPYIPYVNSCISKTTNNVLPL